MRFLADMGVSMRTVRVLREGGHDTAHLSEEGLQRLADDAILEKAEAENRIVLTFDLDFGDLLAAGMRASPSVVIFRLRDETPASVNPRLFTVIEEATDTLARGAIVVVEDARYRVRSLPIRT